MTSNIHRQYSNKVPEFLRQCEYITTFQEERTSYLQWKTLRKILGFSSVTLKAKR